MGIADTGVTEDGPPTGAAIAGGSRVVEDVSASDCRLAVHVKAPEPCKKQPTTERIIDPGLKRQAKRCICGKNGTTTRSRADSTNGYMADLASAYALLCCWGMDEPGHGSVMKMDTSRREALIEALAPSVEAAPPVKLKVRRRPAVKPNCQHPEFSSGLFTGKPRRNPPPLIDVISGMGGGAELDFLEIRLHELNGIVDYVVIPESAFNFRGDGKRRHFKRQMKRFQEFLPRIVYLDLDTCVEYKHHVDKYRNKSKSKRTAAIWTIQASQRQCVWKLLFEKLPDVQPDALVIFTDLDEIPRAEAMIAVKHCELERKIPEDRRIINLRLAALPFNLRVKTCNEVWKQGIIVEMKEARLRKFVPIRSRDQKNWVLKRAGVHLTYAGSLGQVNYKMLQHGESGSFLMPIAGYEKSGSYCLAAASHERLAAMERFLHDDPAFVVQHWQHHCSPLPRGPPDPAKLDDCLVPWVLRENPERYPAFMGTAGGVWT